MKLIKLHERRTIIGKKDTHNYVGGSIAVLLLMGVWGLQDPGILKKKTGTVHEKKARGKEEVHHKTSTTKNRTYKAKATACMPL